MYTRIDFLSENVAKLDHRKVSMANLPLISVVDDDDSIRESLRNLIRSVGFAVNVFASAEEFLNSDHVHNTDCLILDVRMPGMDGLDLQRRLATISNFNSQI